MFKKMGHSHKCAFTLSVVYLLGLVIFSYFDWYDNTPINILYIIFLTIVFLVSYKFSYRTSLDHRLRLQSKFFIFFVVLMLNIFSLLSIILSFKNFPLNMDIMTVNIKSIKWWEITIISSTMVPFVETMIFQTTIQTFVAAFSQKLIKNDRLSSALTVIVSGFLFGILHILYGQPLRALAAQSFAGILFALLFQKFNSTNLVVYAHGGSNLISSIASLFYFN